MSALSLFEIIKRIMLWTSDAWLTSHSSQQTSVLYCRLSDFISYRRTSYSLFKDVGFGKILKQNHADMFTFLFNHSNICIGKVFTLIGCMACSIKYCWLNEMKIMSCTKWFFWHVYDTLIKIHCFPLWCIWGSLLIMH